MKTTLIATTTLALSVSMALASHDVGLAAQKFALEKDSAAERTIGETSQGDVLAAKRQFAAGSESAAEREVLLPGEANAHDDEATRKKFSLYSDSAAERIVETQ